MGEPKEGGNERHRDNVLRYIKRGVGGAGIFRAYLWVRATMPVTAPGAVTNVPYWRSPTRRCFVCGFPGFSALWFPASAGGLPGTLAQCPSNLQVHALMRACPIHLVTTQMQSADRKRPVQTLNTDFGRVWYVVHIRRSCTNGADRPARKGAERAHQRRIKNEQ
jgi:hypothetical protein